MHRSPGGSGKSGRLPTASRLIEGFGSPSDEPFQPRRRLVNRQGDTMQELVSDLAVGLRPAGPGWKLARAFGQAKSEVSQESQREALQRGLEARVAECSALAFSVACGVLLDAAGA